MCKLFPMVGCQHRWLHPPNALAPQQSQSTLGNGSTLLVEGNVPVLSLHAFLLLAGGGGEEEELLFDWCFGEDISHPVSLAGKPTGGYTIWTALQPDRNAYKVQCSPGSVGKSVLEGIASPSGYRFKATFSHQPGH